MVCDYDGSNERLDEKSSFANIWGRADEFCRCGKLAAVVWTHYAEGSKQEIIDARCNRCATSLALGLLRDVAENIFGQDIANSTYRSSVEKLNANFPK